MDSQGILARLVKGGRYKANVEQAASVAVTHDYDPHRGDMITSDLSYWPLINQHAQDCGGSDP